MAEARHVKKESREGRHEQDKNFKKQQRHRRQSRSRNGNGDGPDGIRGPVVDNGVISYHHFGIVAEQGTQPDMQFHSHLPLLHQ